MRATPFAIRNIAGAVLAICGIVVLGISAHVETASRDLGIKTSTFTYDAFVGAYTLFFELAFIALRFTSVQKKLGLGVELLFVSVSWIFWIASGIATTVFTETDRSVCKHLDDLFDLPELQDLDPAALAAAKKILQSACSELHAELAFIWIAFVITTLIVGYTVVLALRQKARGYTLAWRTSYKEHDVMAHSTADPFADPAGSQAGPKVGVARTPVLEADA